MLETFLSMHVVARLFISFVCLIILTWTITWITSFLCFIVIYIDWDGLKWKGLRAFSYYPVTMDYAEEWGKKVASKIDSLLGEKQ